MKKILVISRHHRDDDNPIYNSFLKGISLKREIIFVDYFDEYSKRGKVNFEKFIYELLEKEKIDELFFMFVSGDATLDIQFIYEITKNRYTYMVFWDLEQHFEIIDRYYAQCADLVILPSNKEFKECFNLYNINSHWSFSLFDSEKYVKNLERDIDVSFIGDINKGRRKEYLEYLKDNGIRVEIYGNGSKNGKLRFVEMIEILNRSKITINFSDIYEGKRLSFYKNITDRINQAKGRIVEGCMCGAFLITEDSNCLKNILDKKNIAIFNSKEELLDKVKYFLTNEEERKKKADAAQKEVISKYDSKNIIRIFEQDNKVHSKKVILDKDFQKVYNTFHYFYMIEFFMRGRIKEAIEEFKIVKNGIYKREALLYTKYWFQLYSNYLKFIKSYLVKQKIIKIIENKKFILYPAGDETKIFIKIFGKYFNIIGILDDYGKEIEGYKRVEFNNIKYPVLITNYTFNKVLEDKLKERKITFVNLFKEIDYFNFFFTFEGLINSEKFNIYEIFSRLKEK